ncbi:MAG TPA: hypothetical protein PKY35_14405 [Candidatus Hydrogenedentes bacterium]|nr:hypothetical protein [Candidatus Hydrogenedentota bacterium]HOL78212.1 hypothetical protein [Candidatus Hydrogenedentota bacterium]HPO87227.1 hypothetical protein [Candidatus Hydrogenedentota bacterium]
MNTHRFVKVVLSLALVLGVVGLMYPAYAGEKCAEKCNCSAENCNCKADGATCSSGDAKQTAKCAEKCGCPDGKCQCGDKEGKCEKGKCASTCNKEAGDAGKASCNKEGQSASLEKKAHKGTVLSKASFEGSWSHGAQSSHVN